MSFLPRLFALFILPLAFSTAVATAAPLRVVVTNSLLEDLVRSVAADEAEIVSLVPRGVDPHGYEPRPTDARAVARAQLIFVNGLGFDSWVDRLVSSADATDRTRVLTAGIAPIVCDNPAHDHSHDHGHDHGDQDPHAWQDPRLVMRYIENIRAALTAAAPERAAVFAERAAAYTVELEKLHAESAAAFAAIPSERRVFITSHDALAYLGRAYDLRIVAIRGVGNEREPSARELADITAFIREQKVPAVFIETTTNPRIAELLARDAGVRLGEPLFTDSLGETNGPAGTYLDLFRTNTARIVAALRAE